MVTRCKEKSTQTSIGRKHFSTTWRKCPVVWSWTEHNVAVVGSAAVITWKSVKMTKIN